ncbi:MAG: ThuA domain-containing protein [Chthonomonadales bacterium]|nr:ThuA domain-containing protein [Chthonomonadales bacterium]
MDPQASRIKLAIVTGGHPFDVPGFHALFRGHADIDPYPQEFDNWVHDWGHVRRIYDVTLFYNMHMDEPTGPFREAIEELRDRPQGVVVLHHALLAWPKLEAWNDMVGVADRSFGYHPEQALPVRVASPDHPITRDLSDWEMPEETYVMADPGNDSQTLLTTDHPLSMRSLAWTRRSGLAPVFCFQCGHDRRSWEHPSFREVLARGIRWAAGRLS